MLGTFNHDTAKPDYKTLYTFCLKTFGVYFYYCYYFDISIWLWRENNVVRIRAFFEQLTALIEKHILLTNP